MKQESIDFHWLKSEGPDDNVVRFHRHRDDGGRQLSRIDAAEMPVAPRRLRLRTISFEL